MMNYGFFYAPTSLVLCIILPTLTVQIKTLLEKNYIDKKSMQYARYSLLDPTCNSSTEIDAFLSHVLFINVFYLEHKSTYKVHERFVFAEPLLVGYQP